LARVPFPRVISSPALAQGGSVTKAGPGGGSHLDCEPGRDKLGLLISEGGDKSLEKVASGVLFSNPSWTVT
jgi:hypothetical protein